MVSRRSAVQYYGEPLVPTATIDGEGATLEVDDSGDCSHSFGSVEETNEGVNANAIVNVNTEAMGGSLVTGGTIDRSRTLMNQISDLTVDEEADVLVDGPTGMGESATQQHSLMQESGKMLEYLRNQVFNLRKMNKALKMDKQKLLEINSQAGVSFDGLNQHLSKVSASNQTLTESIAALKDENENLKRARAELKDELRVKQTIYITEVQTRLRYQQTMTKIVDVLQEKCRDTHLVETILVMSDECEEIFDPHDGNDVGRGVTTGGSEKSWFSYAWQT